jgi:hypothetical protein
MPHERGSGMIEIIDVVFVGEGRSLPYPVHPHLLLFFVLL